MVSLVTGGFLFFINREVARVASKLETAERELAETVARRLGIPLCKVAVKIHCYPDGSKLAALELRFGVSQSQLALAQEILDGLVPTRKPNVRTPHPAVN